MKQQKNGNFFARELEIILAAHEQSLDRLDSRLGISAEKVQRLRRSLFSAGSFPLLSPEELENLELSLPLTDTEWIRLQAALLATAIERMLIERVGEEIAFQVAEQIAPRLEGPLHKRFQQLGTKRGPDGEPGENMEIDQAWEEIWNTLNAATGALHLSHYVSRRERVRRLKEAQAGFQEALDELNCLDEDMRSLSLWGNCVREARQGLDRAIEDLEDLGEAWPFDREEGKESRARS